MASCASCGASVPEGQSVCSMCYGDPYYGSDGYYLAALEAQTAEDAARAAYEAAMREEYEAAMREEQRMQSLDGE